MRARLVALSVLLAAAPVWAQMPENPRPVGLPETPRAIGLPDTPRPVRAAAPEAAQSAPSQQPGRAAMRAAPPPMARATAADEPPLKPASEWIERIPLEVIIPPAPARGSAREKVEIAEILRARARATPQALQQARHDNDTENATIFAEAIGPGWDLQKLPKTRFLVDRIMDVDRPDSSAVKHYFHRPRPWIADPRVQTCAPHEDGPAENSYPSGHAMIAFEMGVVLASLMPNHAQAILARADRFAENRIVCGFHFRSDIVAGKQFGTALAVEMMQHPAFQGWFREVQAELKAAGLAR